MKEYSKAEKIIIVNLINKMQHAIREFKEINGKEPNNEELSTFMNKPIEKIIEIKDFLNELEQEDKKVELELELESKFNKYVVTDELIIENKEEYNELKEKIIQNSNLLKDKELEIINLRFGIENEKMFSISEISEKLDISKSFTRICIVRILNLIDNPERVKTTRKVLDNMHKYMKGN